MHGRTDIMRRLRFACVALILLASAGSAVAADLGAPTYRKAPPMAPPPPVYNWSGFYFGGNIGGGWSSLSDTVVTPFAGGAFPAGSSFATNNLSGVLGGVQAGFNWQFGGPWVIGFEGDYMWADLTGNGTSISVPFPAVSFVENSKITDIALATGRLGYAVNNWLFYAKGGGAWGQGSSTSQTFLNGAVVDATSTGTVNRAGWTIGGGIEWAFFNNWSAKIEYNHVDFGTQSVTVNGTFGPVAGAVSNVSGRDTVDIVKAGINYRFNIPGMP
jgi:outer membrane immunogenic protein